MRSFRYLYQLTIAMDACFRLKRRAVSNEQKDPILGSGWGYFVEDVKYREVLAAYADQEEVRLLLNSQLNLRLTSTRVDEYVNRTFGN